MTCASAGQIWAAGDDTATNTGDRTGRWATACQFNLPMAQFPSATATVPPQRDGEPELADPENSV